jgi:hypothetical protein
MVPIVAIEALVFLRVEDLSGGESDCFLLEAFRDSHVNGLVSFRVGAVGGGSESRCCRTGGVGGGGNLTGDILPVKPCMPLPEFRGGRVGVSDDLFSADHQPRTI